MNILVISPHPDDETLGAGASLLKFKESGHKIFWLNMTSMSCEYGYEESLVAKRNDELIKINEKYQFDGYVNLKLRPAGLDQYSYDFLIKNVSENIAAFNVDTVILPYKNDVHSDHRITFEVAYACTKVFRNKSIKKILMMEIPSETEFAASCCFNANYFVDCSSHFERKLSMMEIYKSEMGVHPFPRSRSTIEALAMLRGSQAGVKYAEAFEVIKIIE